MTAAVSLEELVDAMESLPDPEAKRRARALVSGVLALHRDGLAAIGAAIRAEPDGERRLGALLEDPRINALFLLHDMHPLTTLERARRALEAREAELRGVGAEIEAVSGDTHVIRVRVRRGDPSRHGRAVRSLIETAILEHAPDAELLLEGADDAPALVPVDRLTERR